MRKRILSTRWTPYCLLALVMLFIGLAGRTGYAHLDSRSEWKVSFDRQRVYAEITLLARQLDVPVKFGALSVEQMTESHLQDGSERVRDYVVPRVTAEVEGRQLTPEFKGVEAVWKKDPATTLDYIDSIRVLIEFPWNGEPGAVAFTDGLFTEFDPMHSAVFELVVGEKVIPISEIPAGVPLVVTPQLPAETEDIAAGAPESDPWWQSAMLFLPLLGLLSAARGGTGRDWLTTGSLVVGALVVTVMISWSWITFRPEVSSYALAVVLLLVAVESLLAGGAGGRWAIGIVLGTIGGSWLATVAGDQTLQLAVIYLIVPAVLIAGISHVTAGRESLHAWLFQRIGPVLSLIGAGAILMLVP